MATDTIWAVIFSVFLVLYHGRARTKRTSTVLRKKYRKIVGAGPIFSPDFEEGDPESKPLGSLVFFNAPDDDAARDLVENDPYNEAGLFESIYIARYAER